MAVKMIKPLFWLRWSKNKMRSCQNLSNERGATIVESLVVVPSLMLVGMAIVHFALVAQAKSNLDYAALMAARIAASEPEFGQADGINRLEAEIVKRMKASDSFSKADSDPCYATYAQIKVCVLSPNKAMFNDYGEAHASSGGTYIPNDNLPYRPITDDRSSGVSIQDANILHLKIGYMFDSGVPGMKMFSPGMLAHGPEDGLGDDEAKQRRGGGSYDAPLPGHQVGRSCDIPRTDTNGVYLISYASVVMQTPAILSATSGMIVKGETPDPFCQ